MTTQTFFEQIKGKKIDISRLNPDPGCSPSQSSYPPGWYYLAHRYIINPDNLTIKCVPLDSPVIAYGDEDSTYFYSIAIFINGWLFVLPQLKLSYDKTCCNSNPVMTNNCMSGNVLEPCIAFVRMNKSVPTQIDENIPIEIENKALSTLPFVNNSNMLSDNNNFLYIGITIGALALLYLMKKRR